MGIETKQVFVTKVYSRGKEVDLVYTKNAVAWRKPIKITISNSSCGRIDKIDGSLLFGRDVTFTIQPDTNCKIVSFAIDGVAQSFTSSGMTYTFYNLSANHTISATFERLPYWQTVWTGNYASRVYESCIDANALTLNETTFGSTKFSYPTKIVGSAIFNDVVGGNVQEPLDNKVTLNNTMQTICSKVIANSGYSSWGGSVNAKINGATLDVLIRSYFTAMGNNSSMGTKQLIITEIQQYRQ